MSTQLKTKASEAVTKARVDLITGHLFYGSLALNLKLRELTTIKTLRTDGTHLDFNPEFVLSQEPAENVFTVAHETMHCSFRHPYRTNGRDLQMWNEACDHYINLMLIDMKIGKPPKGILADPQYTGMGADQIYAILDHKKQQQKQQPKPDPKSDKKQDKPGDPQSESGAGKPGKSDQSGKPDPNQSGAPGDQSAPDQGKGKPDPSANQPGGDQSSDSPTGDFVPAPDPASQPKDPATGKPTEQVLTESDWQIAIEQAIMVSQKAGAMPGGALTALRAEYKARTRAKDLLQQFVEKNLPSEYSWSKPNRRFVGRGIYLPGQTKENMPRLAVGFDSSGSTKPLIKIFSEIITAILHECKPAAIDVYYCDTEVSSIETFTPDDPEIEFKVTGFGGTKFQPVFDAVAAGDNPDPTVLIYFTDMDSSDTPKDPGFPVIWVCPERIYKPAPFGEVVRLSEFE